MTLQSRLKASRTESKVARARIKLESSLKAQLQEGEKCIQETSVAIGNEETRRRLERKDLEGKIREVKNRWYSKASLRSGSSVEPEVGIAGSDSSDSEREEDDDQIKPDSSRMVPVRADPGRLNKYGR